MTKVATIDTRRFSALLLITAMLATMIPFALFVFPSGVLAHDNISVSGNFTVSNGAPTVDLVALHTHPGGAATSMNPFTTEYEVWVTASDNGTLHSLTTIVVTLYYDADGTYSISDRPVSANNNTCAIITYTHVHGGTDTWVMSNGTTWLLGADCVPPSLDGNTGTYQFVFRPGKVAQETSDYSSEWHIYAVASDGTGTGDGYQENQEMNWYGEINDVTTEVSFGTVTLGQTQKISSAISANYISNGAFDEQVKTDSTWIGPTKTLTLDEDGTPGNGYFTIEADDDNDAGGAVWVKNTAYTAVDDGNQTMTDEAGHTQANNYLWLTLGSTGIPPETYSGTLWYAIANGS